SVVGIELDASKVYSRAARCAVASSLLRCGDDTGRVRAVADNAGSGSYRRIGCRAIVVPARAANRSYRAWQVLGVGSAKSLVWTRWIKATNIVCPASARNRNQRRIGVCQSRTTARAALSCPESLLDVADDSRLVGDSIDGAKIGGIAER